MSYFFICLRFSPIRCFYHHHHWQIIIRMIGDHVMLRFWGMPIQFSFGSNTNDKNENNRKRKKSEYARRQFSSASIKKSTNFIFVSSRFCCCRHSLSRVILMGECLAPNIYVCLNICASPLTTTATALVAGKNVVYIHSSHFNVSSM